MISFIKGLGRYERLLACMAWIVVQLSAECREDSPKGFNGWGGVGGWAVASTCGDLLMMSLF